MKKQNKDLYKYALGSVAFALILILIIELFNRSSKPQIKDVVNNLTRSSTKSYPTRSLDGVSQIVVHHSASLTHKAEDFARWHVFERGWAGIGYHYVIEKDGTIKQTNYLKTRSNHVGGANTKSVGICLSGNFDKENPTKAQLDSLGKLIKFVRGEFSQPLEVYGHRDFSNTSCCGDMLYDDIAKYKLRA